MQFFEFYLPHLRQKKIGFLKGRKVICFPAAYTKKIMGNKKLLWENVTESTNGVVYKTAPDWLIDDAVKFCKKHNLECSLYTIEGEPID